MHTVAYCVVTHYTHIIHTCRDRVISQTFAALNQGGKPADAEHPPLPLPSATALVRPPLVSCVVPTTGGRQWCHAQLHARFDSQTYPNKELVVLDDAPTPSPFFSTLTDHRVRYVHRLPSATTQPLGAKCVDL